MPEKLDCLPTAVNSSYLSGTLWKKRNQEDYPKIRCGKV